MPHRNKKVKKRKRRNQIARFFKIVFSMVLTFVVIAGAGVFAYSKFVGFEQEEPLQGSEMNFMDAFVGKDITLNVAVFGVDGDGTRTDVIFIVHFDSKSGKIGLMSVPRDTRVEINDAMYTYLVENGKYIPSGAVCKINEVHAYAGKEKANEFSIIQLEELLGIEIDHFVKVNFESFRALVDLVGGIDFYVPQDMYWDMRDTGDPLINLKEGMQHLDGEKAEQLVRFRRYPLGDVQRVQVQQDFLMALAEKLLSDNNLIKNLPGLVKTAYEYVETDITLSDALKYVQYADDADLSKIQMETIPGEGQMVGGVSYYLVDEVEAKAAVNRIFFSDDVEAVEEGTTEEISSVGKNIEVANGGYKSGFAAENQQMLENEGFTISGISTYNGEKTANTRIFVSEEGMGKDIQGYYPNSEIIVEPSMLGEGIDILIILGTDE